MKELIERYNELTNPKVESLAKVTLVLIETIIEDIEENGRQNEQWFLDYLDRLNELSVTH
jgi:hypothetical protein